MNSSTVATTTEDTTTRFPIELLFPYFKNSQITINVYLYGFSITFLFGFLGNTASLLTFSRPTLRKVSTGCLFIILAISDLLFLIASVFDFIEYGLQVSFYGYLNYNVLCRFRWFVISVSQLCSTWLLIIISIDRWIRTRFPFKAGTLCTPKKALLAAAILITVTVGLNSHYLLPSFGMLIPGYTVLACSPDPYDTSDYTFYFYVWNVIELLTTCLIPVIVMLGTVIDIFITIHIRKQAINRNADGSVKRDENLQKQMFFLMLASVSIFFITTLPLAIYRIISPRLPLIYELILNSVNILNGLTWLQSLNYAVNFYSHCLSSKLFRRQFIEQMQFICSEGRKMRVMPMHLIQTGHQGQTQTGHRRQTQTGHRRQTQTVHRAPTRH